MSMHFGRAIEALKQRILELSAIVEESVRDATTALVRGDCALAQRIIDNDGHVDQMEVDIEEECLKLLALHQPVAIDLRLMVAVLKINNDLERIGDLAVNIAERALYLGSQPPIDHRLDFETMMEKAQAMLSNSLNSLVRMDPSLARAVCAKDDEVDALNSAMYGLIEKAIQRNPENTPYLLHLLSVSRHLERIADQATNIAEDVIYMVTGDIVRHRTENYQLNEDER
jgi:phosphate transport system protein